MLLGPEAPITAAYLVAVGTMVFCGLVARLIVTGLQRMTKAGL
jgi:hypothetical protein